MPRDIVERLRDRAYSGLPDPLLAEAADEIERLRSGALSARETVRSVTTPMPASASGIGSVSLTDAEREAIDASAVVGPDPDSRVWETHKPQPILTAAEREAVEQAIDAANGMGQAEPWTMRTLRGLLERLS